MENMRILAIDPATLSGWAISKDLYGTWNLRTRSDESWGMKLIRFRRHFTEILESYPSIEIVTYERPAGRNTRGIITQSKIIGIIESEVVERGLDFKAFSPGEIKKFATGKGNSGKPAMIEAAQKKYNYDGNDDNEADALHLLYLSRHVLLGKIKRTT